MIITLDETTLRLLKNFAGVTNQVVLHPGKSQRTMLSSRSVLVRAEFPEDWPKETAIYNLSGFLNALTLFKTPQIDFGEDVMVLTQEGSATKIRFHYSDPSTVLAAPDKRFPFENPSLTVKLSQETLAQMKKTASILNLSHVRARIENDTVVLLASDPSNPSSNGWEYTVPAEDITIVESGIKRSVLFKVEHFSLLLEGAYTLALEKTWQYGYFTHDTLPISYYVTEQNK